MTTVIGFSPGDTEGLGLVLLYVKLPVAPSRWGHGETIGRTPWQPQPENIESQSKTEQPIYPQIPQITPISRSSRFVCVICLPVRACLRRWRGRQVRTQTGVICGYVNGWFGGSFGRCR